MMHYATKTLLVDTIGIRIEQCPRQYAHSKSELAGTGSSHIREFARKEGASLVEGTFDVFQHMTVHGLHPSRQEHERCVWKGVFHPYEEMSTYALMRAVRGGVDHGLGEYTHFGKNTNEVRVVDRKGR